MTLVTRQTEMLAALQEALQNAETRRQKDKEEQAALWS